MNIAVRNKLLNQLEKYDLKSHFKDHKELNKFLNDLTKLEIENFLSLNIPKEEIVFPKHLLINKELLHCDDYLKRIEAMNTLKNGLGCFHLYDKLCTSEFLNSHKYYEDINKLSKAPTTRYGLWVIGETAFINSPYHDEDLDRIVKRKHRDKFVDSIISECLATVAKNPDSIKSKWHKLDMDLIENNPESSQMVTTYPNKHITNLAINRVSLNDKHHYENMLILVKNPLASKYLYNIMTNHAKIKGEYYQEELKALVNAKSKIKALAMYYYIVNPKDRYKFSFIDEFDCIWELESTSFIRQNGYLDGEQNPKYIKYLKLLNEIDDEFVLHVESLLTNPTSFYKSYQDFDIEILKNIKNMDIFLDLFKVMNSLVSLESPHHKNDVIRISSTENKGNRMLLVKTATNKENVKSKNHLKDMEYIANLDFENLSEETIIEIKEYLLTKKGIKSLNRDKILQELAENKNISAINFDNNSGKVLKRIRKLLKKIN